MYIYSLLYHNCITCNSTLYTYLFLYYKMQVVFKGFRQRSGFCGGIFTLKKLINWRAMPIVVLLYSQPKNLNSIQPNLPKIHSKKSSLLPFGQNQTISTKTSNHTSSKIPTKSPQIIKSHKFNPQKSK